MKKIENVVCYYDPINEKYVFKLPDFYGEGEAQQIILFKYNKGLKLTFNKSNKDGISCERLFRLVLI